MLTYLQNALRLEHGRRAHAMSTRVLAAKHGEYASQAVSRTTTYLGGATPARSGEDGGDVTPAHADGQQGELISRTKARAALCRADPTSRVPWRGRAAVVSRGR